MCRQCELRERISGLLSEHNMLADPIAAGDIELARYYVATSESVFKAAEYTGEAEAVVGCVRLGRVQTYQAEVRHLVVDPAYRGKGVARKLLKAAEAHQWDTVGLLQATIRVGNLACEKLFDSCGWKPCVTFTNPKTGRLIRTWQKSLTPVD